MATDTGQEHQKMRDQELEDLVASTDSGARNPPGFVGKMIAGIALFTRSNAFFGNLNTMIR